MNLTLSVPHVSLLSAPLNIWVCLSWVFYFETESCCIVQAGLEFEVLLFWLAAGTEAMCHHTWAHWMMRKWR